jgi:tetratricopeptide (TPR) repeat protein
MKARLRSLCIWLLAAPSLAVVSASAGPLPPACGAPNTDWIVGCTVIIDNPLNSEATRAKALRIRGIAEYKQGRLDAAIKDFSAVIALEPKNVAVYVNRAGAYKRKGDYAQALADYNSAAGLAPQQPWVFLERGRAYKAMHDFAHARQDFDEAIRLGPKVSTFVRERGKLRTEQGDLNGAGADLDAAIRLNGNDFMTYLARGELRVAQKDYDNAIADYDKALSIQPNSPQAAALVYSARAMAFGEKGDLKRALNEYDALLKVEPGNPIHLEGRGYTAFALGDFAAAAESFGGAIGKNPGAFYSVLMRYVARARMGEHDTPELRRNAQALDRSSWRWLLVGLFLGETKPDQLRASTVSAIGREADTRKCEVSFFLAEYDLLHRRRQEAASLMQEAAKNCGFDVLERNAAQGEAKRLQP